MLHSITDHITRISDLGKLRTVLERTLQRALGWTFADIMVLDGAGGYHPYLSSRHEPDYLDRTSPPLPKLAHRKYHPPYCPYDGRHGRELFVTALIGGSPRGALRCGALAESDKECFGHDEIKAITSFTEAAVSALWVNDATFAGTREVKP